jgi:hypothetical protein
VKGLLELEEEQVVQDEPEDPDADLMRSKKPTRQQLRRDALDDCARKEMDWFFGALGGRVPEPNTELGYARPAAERIHRWLQSITEFHRGALALRFTPRRWPPWLTKRYRKSTSLVVRLECALHPSTGQTTEMLEQASVERLAGLRPKQQRELLARARSHEFLGLRAYEKVRGNDLHAVRIPERPTDGEQS